MFEKEIKFIGDFCLNQVKHLGPHFTFEKITATDLHPAITRYISAELDFMIFSDRRKLLQHSYFDYSGKKIAEHFIKINEEIKRNKRIAFDDAKKLIVQAVSFNANFVVRPNWSLSHLIFNDQESVSYDEMEMMLNYIYYYEHLKNILLAFLAKRKIDQITKTEFDLTLRKIDQELLKSSTERLIDNALSSISDYFNIGGLDRNLISPVAVEIFFKEKNLFNYLLKLRKGIPDAARKIYTINALKKIIYATEEPEKQEEIKSTAKSDEVNLGELAEKHAQDLDKAGPEDFINLEEEEALLALYEEELKDLPPEEINGTIETELLQTEKSEPDLNGKPDIQFTHTSERAAIQDEFAEEFDNILSEKEIVNEMIRDYFGDMPPEKDEMKISGKKPEEVPLEDKPAEDIVVRKTVSFEEELMEVFEELDDPGTAGSEIIEESKTKHEPTEYISEVPLADQFVTDSDEEEIEVDEGAVQTEEDSIIPKTISEAGKSHEDKFPLSDQDLYQRETGREPEKEQSFNSRAIRKKDLFSYISRKEMKKIVSHIFLRDEEDFINTSEKIMECNSYREASDILKAVFSSYKISPYSKDAVNFTNAVSNYFRQA